MIVQHLNPDRGNIMTIRRGYSIVLSLVALCGSSLSSGAQESASVAATVTRPAPAGAGEETVPAGEAQVIEEFKTILLKEMKDEAAPDQPKKRGQHPKPHGFVVAKFTVLEGLPEELKIGLFREPRPYTAVIRFSNTAAKDDSTPDTHGMAIKLLGVKGKKLLEGEEDAETQDFVMIDHPLFFAQDVASTLEIDKTTGALLQDEAMRKRLKGLLTEKEQRGELTNALAEKRPKEVGIMQLRRSLRPSPLAAEYFSTTPYKFGETAVKYSAQPKPPHVAVRTKMEGENYLRKALVEQLTERKQPATFGFYVQRQGDPKAMPIEDPTVKWMSAWEEVATIEIGAQDFDFPKMEAWGNALSYTPWHALKEHRPLGGINRARKVIYPASSELRHQNRGAPLKEPAEADIPMKK